MELHPILSAMRRNKVGALVIVAQTAITLAIFSARRIDFAGGRDPKCLARFGATQFLQPDERSVLQ